MALLLTIGLMFIYSATHLTEGWGLESAVWQQMFFLGIGIVLFTTISMIDYKVLLQNGYLIYGFGILLLLMVLIFGREVNGAKSWIRIAGFGFQPAEFMKVFFIFGLVQLMIQFRDKIKSFKIILILGAFAAVPLFLIMRQPDLGSACVFGPIVFLALFVAGTRKVYIITPLVCAFIFAAFIYIYVGQMGKDIPGLKTYQNNRIKTFFDPNLDPRGAGWTIRQSMIAIGTGGVTGKGFLKGEQNVYGFLPRNITHNDFIFSVIAEEGGFLIGSIVILAQASLITCLLYIGSKARDWEGMVLAAAFAGMFFTHFFINIGMTIKVVPITGIPLPLVSYGGTFLLTCMMALGTVQSIWIHRNTQRY
jgi:rod shape determining protein RodA